MVNRDAFWHILHYSYQLPPKLLAIICVLHENSSAAVKTNGKVSDKFPVTNGVRQGRVLAPALFNLYFDVTIHMALDEHRSQGMGIKVAYHHDADLVGNRKISGFESLVTDLEYIDDMALLSDVTSPQCWTLYQTAIRNWVLLLVEKDKNLSSPTI